MSEIPETVEQLLFWMTKKDRSERPESYEALAARIRSILDGRHEAAASRAARMVAREFEWSCCLRCLR